MLRNILVLTTIITLTACQSDDNGGASAPVITEVTVYENWEKNTPKARAAIEAMVDMTELAETEGELPSFFTNTPLLNREERDNVQHGYAYPLYFVDKTHDYPARQWEDGYTVIKGDINDPLEKEKVERSQAEMIEFWTGEGFLALFEYLTQYPLIDVRHYSLRKAPPGIVETCFTVAFRNHSRGAVNYCFAGHRMLPNKQGQYPAVRWSMNQGSQTQLDALYAWKLFVVGIAAHEVIFDNPDNRKLRDLVLTPQTLSVQMHQSNKAFDGIFEFVVDQQNYLKGRQ